MKQLALFKAVETHLPPLPTNIERDADRLLIPENLHTIPCTHGIHRFAGKFIPNLPRYIIRNILSARGGRGVILDPFCGSGTTLVEAALEGIPFVGLDIDRLAVMISRVKCTALDPVELTHLEDFWTGAKLVPDSTLIPDVPNLSHWFTDRASEELSAIKALCLELPARLRQFSLVVLSSIIRRVSNADDQTQKTYVSHTLPKSPPAPSEIYSVFMARAIKGMRDLGERVDSVSGEITQGDAVASISNLEFQDVITSPPYIDSIDYVYNQMLEYFWLLPELEVGTYQNYQAARKIQMGFRQYPSNDLSCELAETIGEAVDELGILVEQITEKSPKEGRVVRGFFYDYARHVRAVAAKQESGAYYVSVIGRSLIRGISVPTDELLERIHENYGYELIDKLTYEIRRHYMKFPRRSNSGTIKQDFVLVFRKR